MNIKRIINALFDIIMIVCTGRNFIEYTNNYNEMGISI